MIWLQKICVDENIKSEFVKCPSCGKGRLCDKAAGEKATAILSPSEPDLPKNRVSVILKCPRCSSKFLIHLGIDEN